MTETPGFSDNSQQAHFEHIHNDYVNGYEDICSIHYKSRCIYPHVSTAINKFVRPGGTVLEIACGSGKNAELIKLQLQEGINIVGSDISRRAVLDFKELHGDGSSFVWDFTKQFNSEAKYDAVLILGGVHHMINGLEILIKNIERILLPGGIFIFVEPNGRFMDRLRKFWYQRDKYFDANDEEAINHDHLFTNYGKDFDLQSITYIGGPGFFLILQSLILRIPKFIKRIITRPATAFDKLYEKIAPPGFLPAFVAVWKKI